MKKIIFLLALLGIFLFDGLSSAQEIESYKIIVNGSNPISSMTKDQVSKLFLKKVTKWKNGQKVLPLDLTGTSPVRQDFSKEIFGRHVWAIKAYWQKKIFSGRGVPPPEKSSDREVLAYVQENPGAIGYISASVITIKYRVKVLNVEK